MHVQFLQSAESNHLTLLLEWKALTNMPLSSSQFGGGDTDTPSVDIPMSLGASTTGSVAQETAWRTPRRSKLPLAYTKKSAGTTFFWDDDKMPQMPSSDKGVGK
jgi:hypothetical protein